MPSRSAPPMVEDYIEFEDDEVVDLDPRENPDFGLDEERLEAIKEIYRKDQALLTEEELDLYDKHFGQQDKLASLEGHWANLAEVMEEDDLRTLGSDIIEWVREDEQSRSEWFSKEKSGIRALGVTKSVDGGVNFEGASKAVHPALAEACVRFASTAMDSLWPTGGPVRAVPLGEKNPDKIAQAYRVQNFMNDQYTWTTENIEPDQFLLIDDAYESMDQALHRLPLSGSVFTKLWVDPVHGLRRRMVEPADFVVPYNASSLYTCSRYTERVRVRPAEFEKAVASGYYRDVDLSKPTIGTSDVDSFRTEVTDEIDDAEGREETIHGGGDRNDIDTPHTFYECTCEIVLEDIDGEDNEGAYRQYVITVDSDTQKVLSIYRNWKPNDPTGRRIVWHRHYRFTPGLGFYGFGFYHWVSGLSTAATGALRALLDAALLSNLQGGFRSKQAGIRSGDVKLIPGQWQEVDVDIEDLAKAFYRPPYSEPSAVLFNLMTHTEELFQRFAGTVDSMVGEGTQNTPVGTILARIEQGSKILTSVQKRLHYEQRKELNLLYWIDSSILPVGEYIYDVAGAERSVRAEDFSGGVALNLSTNPALISNAQKYFLSKESLELAGMAPQYYDMRAMHVRAQTILGIENLHEIMPPPDAPLPRLDPVTENATLMQGRPVRAFMEQDHQAHIAVHMQFISSLPDDAQKQIGGAMQAHVAEHYAQGYLVQMSQMTGQTFTGEAQEIPPEQEARIAQMVAQAIAQVPLQAPPIDEAAAEQARKDAEVQARIARQDQAAEASVRREDTKAAAAIRREDIAAVSKV